MQTILRRYLLEAEQSLIYFITTGGLVYFSTTQSDLLEYKALATHIQVEAIAVLRSY